VGRYANQFGERERSSDSEQTLQAMRYSHSWPRMVKLAAIIDRTVSEFKRKRADYIGLHSEFGIWTH
jgi:hypothetical protein